MYRHVFSSASRWRRPHAKLNVGLARSSIVLFAFLGLILRLDFHEHPDSIKVALLISQDDMTSYQAVWPNGAHVAIALTIDNMGEAADLNRGLWPEDEPIGKHFSVMEVLPKFLSILRKYDVKATYFIEAWNLSVYHCAIAKDIAGAGHEIGWHAWCHEPWGKLEDEETEMAIVARSFGEEGLKGFKAIAGSGESETTVMYKGFRPPGGLINADRTLKLCKKYDVRYVSPAGQDAALVKLKGSEDSIVILPFRWSTVDAYYYMETFAKLRQSKGELPEEPQSEDVLKQRCIEQIDRAIIEGGYLSFLFHPFLNNKATRLDAFEAVVRYLALKRDDGKLWLARCCDIAEWINGHRGIVGSDPALDETQWR